MRGVCQGCQYTFVTSEMVRNSTCHNHWQWEREENTNRVCTGNGHIWVFLQGKTVHLSRPVRQRVNISWYLEGVRGARCEEILQNSLDINRDRNKNQRALCDFKQTEYCLYHGNRGCSVLGFTSQPELGTLG